MEGADSQVKAPDWWEMLNDETGPVQTGITDDVMVPLLHNE